MKIIGKIIGFLYSIICSIVLLTIPVLLCGSNLLKGSFYSEVFKNVELDNINASDLGLSDDPNKTVEDVLEDTITEMGIEKDVADAILNDDEIKEVVGDVLGDIANYYVNEDEVPTVSKEEVKKVLNNPEIKKLMDEELTDSDINELVSEINKALEEVCLNGSDLNV